MLLRGVAIALIKGIGFDNRTVGNLGLKGLNHIARQDVRSVALTGVQLNGHFAVNFAIDKAIQGN